MLFKGMLLPEQAHSYLISKQRGREEEVLVSLLGSGL